MSIETTWLEPTGLTRGQDHLSARAVSEILYTQLLPGLTNVTERVRYYTLYPWLLWVMDQEAVPVAERTMWFRKADCLLTFIALAHGEGDSHRRAAIGTDTLAAPFRQAVESGDALQLSRWARTDNDTERYFANSRGGFGQYYLGPLEDLRVVGRDKHDAVTWTFSHGQRFAKAVDASVDRGRFARCVREDRVTLEDLAALGGLCLCELHPGSEEHTALVDVLWADPQRRDTLGLILALSRDLNGGVPLTVEAFRGTTASGALPDGTAWTLPDRLEQARRRWAIYQRSEWLSLALQGLFWATLQAFGPDAEVDRLDTFGARAVEEFLPLGDLDASVLLQDAILDMAGALPAVGAWTDAEHEHARAVRIARCSGTDQVAHDSLALILSLLARGTLGDAFEDVVVSPTQQSVYPVHLPGLEALRSRWSARPLGAVVHELATTWGVRLHTTVATRKLRHQLTDTFQVRPTDRGGWRITGTPAPVFSNPRVAQGIRALTDLGAIDRQAGRPTALGLQLLERAHG